jgi:arylsulfatase A-like enzyme
MGGALACGGERTRPGEPPQRLLLIVVDTLRRDFLSCYGSENPTPNIDALAGRGQIYTQYMASFHQTSMSMGSLFTGRTPSLEQAAATRRLFWNSSTWCGLYRFSDQGDDELCLPPTLPTLAEVVRDSGYWTIGIPSNQYLFEPSGFSRGFDDWVEVGVGSKETGPLARLKLPGAAKSRYFSHVNRATLEAVDRRPSDRFFLYVHYMDAHDYGGRGAGRYAKAVSSVDWAIGALLKELRSRDLLDDTVVILTSDHGERIDERHALRGRAWHEGNPSFQELLRIPLIIAPGVDRDPDAFLRTEDLFQVIGSIVGAPGAAAPELAPDELFLTELDYLTYLRGRFKSILRRDGTSFHLFDLAADPRELHDVSSAHPEVEAQHRSRMEALGRKLAATRPTAAGLKEADRERLRALGYLNETEPPALDPME